MLINEIVSKMLLICKKIPESHALVTFTYKPSFDLAIEAFFHFLFVQPETTYH